MEFVYVVPRGDLFPHCAPHGFQPFGQGPGTDLAAFRAAVERHGFFVEREHAERTPALKQVIPYCVVECGGRVLVVQRSKRGGDARLHDKHSLGIGGHLEPRDLARDPERRDGPVRQESPGPGARDPIPLGTRRELQEELELHGDWEAIPVGLINDDTNPVGAVHVGLVQVVRVQGTVAIREREQLQGHLMPLEQIDALLEQGADFESWSRLLVPHLAELLRGAGLVREPLAART